MIVIVCRHKAGAVWLEDAQGATRAPCFFKTAEETEDALQAMGYPRRLTAYPTAHIVAGPGIAPVELGEVFLERPPGGSAPDGDATTR